MSGVDLTSVYLHGDSVPFAICVDVETLTTHWVNALNDPEVARLLWLPVLLGEEDEPSVQPALIDIRRAVAMHRADTDGDPLDVAAAITAAREARPDLFPDSADAIAAAEKKLADAGLGPIQRDLCMHGRSDCCLPTDPDPGVASPPDAGGRPQGRRFRDVRKIGAR